MSDSELFGGSDSGSESPHESLSQENSPQVSGNESEEERIPLRLDSELLRTAPSHGTADAWLARVPAFLKFERRPFDKASYANSTEADRKLTADSVRWQYTRADEEDRVVRTSNARIVEWSDGSRTLQVGDEHFVARMHSQTPALVCASSEGEPGIIGTLLPTRLLVDKTAAFIPTSTSSATHALLAGALARRQQSGQVRVGSVSTVEDPEKAQRDLEKAEQLREKARRKLAAQRAEKTAAHTSVSRKRYSSESNSEPSEAEESEAEESEAEATEESEEEASERTEKQEEDAMARLNRIKERTIDDSDESG